MVYNFFRLKNTLHAVDFFQRPIPSFNIQGRDSVPSLAGGILSFLVLIILIIYALLKFVNLIDRANVNLTSFAERSVIPPDEKLNFQDAGLQFAFGVEGFHDK